MTEQAKPTPGPWTAEIVHSGEPGWRIVSDAPGYPNGGWIICGDMIGPDSEANARLIAAAPDMLMALRACELVVSKSAAPPDWDWIRQVIAKAENRHGDL